jgi:type IV pilus assembly protein PilW
MNATAAARHPVKKILGMSLIELLVAMALGVLLTGGAAGMYLASKNQLHHEDQLARIQENGRYATRLISRELAMSGFYGGMLSTASLATVRAGVDCNSSAWALDSNDPLELVDNHSGTGVPLSVGGTQLTCIDGGNVVPDSDLLAVKRTAADASVINGVARDGLTASGVSTWFLQTTEGVSPRWQQRRPMSFLGGAVLGPSVTYWKASSRILFLRSYARYPGDGVPSLCMSVLAGDAMTVRCLVEGVEQFQVEFGIDSDGDGSVDLYPANPTHAQLKQARVARVHLLVRSISPLPGYLDDKVYQLGTREVTARADAYMRRVFSVTATLGNFEDSRFAEAY